jgi:hypothetical protein
MELSLRNYLAGHILREGMLLFEDAMGPWVKEQARLHYRNKFQLDPDDDDRVAADYAAAVSVHEAHRDALIASRDELEKLLNAGPKDGKKVASQRKNDVSKLLTAHISSPPPPPPAPRWVEACREFFGQLMKPHVNATNRWDVHTIVVVIRALLPDVFAPFMPDHFHAKELLDGIQRVVEMRAGRAHRVALTESEVLEALRQMVAVVRRCVTARLASLACFGNIELVGGFVAH